MKWLIYKFKCWRRKPFKRVIMRYYSSGKIRSHLMHEMLADIDRV